MNIHTIGVPAGIRYISEWKEFRLFNFPYIIDKQITGCGFTEFASERCKFNTLTSSPRVGLLRSKYEQYLEKLKNGEISDSDYKMFYAESKWENVVSYDDNLMKERKGNMVRLKEIEDRRIEKEKEETIRFKQAVKDFWKSCQGDPKKGTKSVPCKILVTYDSYRKVKEALIEVGAFEYFHTIVDEFQSIFTDARFKSSAELEFVNNLRGVQKVCYVSATPMIEKYLDQMDEFKDLPYLRLDWGMKDPSRITHPIIRAHSCEKMVAKAVSIIDKYRTNSWRDKENNKIIELDQSGNPYEIESKEAVFYFNSVTNICEVIKKAKLTLDDVNVLCADTEINRRKVRKALDIHKRGVYGVGKVPLMNEPRKMFTMCTRTVYLGADFYSDNARSFIFSDANINCLSVDITLDLPQILGRQRLDSNPWKTTVDLFFNPIDGYNQLTEEEFNKFLERKLESTDTLLKIYDSLKEEYKLTQTNLLLANIRLNAYNLDYVSVNKHDGASPYPVLNKLVKLSDIRAYEISQVDYADRCSVLSRIGESYGQKVDPVAKYVIEEIDKRSEFEDKLRFLCESLSLMEKDGQTDVMMEVIRIAPESLTNYYKVLGPSGCSAVSYRRSLLEKEYNKLKNNLGIDIDSVIYSNFNEGDSFVGSDLKVKLQGCYNGCGYKSKAKASDIENWFEVTSKQEFNRKTGTRGLVYNLIKKKK